MLTFPLNPLTTSTRPTSLAWNADHIELEKPGRNAARMRVQETGEPMREGVVATVAGGEDEQEFGGIGDRYTSVGDVSEETTHEGNEMDVDTTSTHITTAQAHYLLITNPTYEEIGYPNEAQAKQSGWTALLVMVGVFFCFFKQYSPNVMRS
ncbi:hypothetical protein EV359DRAFT_83916 [Lentinula novae-zelandiae]|nr:hypothetical protein EV359DRAFT_83916 [Lentinula novae-zelandiae]